MLPKGAGTCGSRRNARPQRPNATRVPKDKRQPPVPGALIQLDTMHVRPLPGVDRLSRRAGGPDAGPHPGEPGQAAIAGQPTTKKVDAERQRTECGKHDGGYGRLRHAGHSLVRGGSSNNLTSVPDQCSAVTYD